MYHTSQKLETSQVTKPAFFNGKNKPTPFFQAKLTVNTPGDAHEQEADRVADQVMRMKEGDSPIAQSMPLTPLGKVMRMCDQCAEEEKEGVQRKETGSGDVGGKAAPSMVGEVLSSGGGRPMEGGIRQLMESRFGQDFSQVRIHTGGRAAESAQAIQAKAYTSGRDVVFGKGEYQPSSDEGARLLAHELAHVGQQQGENASRGSVARFSDAGHHVVEEYGLRRGGLDAAAVAEIKAANTTERIEDVKNRYHLTDSQIRMVQTADLSAALRLTEEEIERIHEGNTQRDYSQMPTGIANAVLLGRPSLFGGYNPTEHFDNFIFDLSTQQWRTREFDEQHGSRPARVSETSPIDFIGEQMNLMVEERAQPEASRNASLLRVGNAFHAVEDFFAHSNFTELIQNDYRHGRELITANLEGPSDSISHVMERISAPEMRETYHEQAEAAFATAPPTSHTRMNKDHPGAHNYTIARRLAALVIEELTTDLLIAMLAPTVQARKDLLQETFMAKIRDYLRPPNPDNPWWERLQERRSPRSVDAELDRIQRRTPETVNQSPFSPLRNIEASAQGPMRFGLGAAVPIRVGSSYIWIQAGALGVIAPPTGSRDQEQSGVIWGGAQVGWAF